MIRVLMIGNHSSNKGGMTSVINQIRAHDWKGEGIELSFIPSFIPGNAIKKIIYFICSYIRVLVCFIVSKPDIVHMHMSYKGSFQRKYLIHKLCRFFCIQDIIHLHGSEFEKWFYSVNKKKQKQIESLLSSCSCMIVLGEKWKCAVKRISPSANVRVISNGVSIPDTVVSWNDSKIQLLYLGVLIHRKGISVLIDAIKGLPEEIKRQVKLIIAGTGEEEKFLKERVNKHNLGQIINFVGWISDDEKERYIKDSQIMILPSFNEGLPVSILEALSYGMPVIATDVGDISSAVIDKENGFLFEPGDERSLCESIIKLSEKECFIAMSRKARRIAEEKFSLESFYGNLLSCYKSNVKLRGHYDYNQNTF